MWTIALIILGIVVVPLVLIGALQWFYSPAQYHGISFEELQRFFSDWAAHVGERRDILVGSPSVPNLIQFRKKQYKTRPDLLLFRFRNADASKPYFDAVVSALKRENLKFQIELTKKRRAPRAAVVELDASDALLPSAAAHLCKVTLAAVGHPPESGASVCCTGLKPDFDHAAQQIIPVTRADYTGWRLGFLLGAAVRSIRGWLLP